MSERMTIECTGGVADVRLNRPDKMNALDPAMLDGIADAGARLAAMPGLRAVVLSGEGPAFCAGLDIASFARLGGTDIESRSHGAANLFQHVAMLWRELPVPVIAAVRGPCFGGGLQIALGADIRIAAPDARLSFMEMKWGIVPDMGGFALTRGLVRGDVLRELVYSARIVGPEEARTIGLVTRIADDPHEAAMSMARAVAANNPDAIRRAKALANLSEVADEAEILMAESRAQAEIVARPNSREAVAAAMEKRPPRFAD